MAMVPGNRTTMIRLTHELSRTGNGRLEVNELFGNSE